MYFTIWPVLYSFYWFSSKSKFCSIINYQIALRYCIHNEIRIMRNIISKYKISRNSLSQIFSSIFSINVFKLSTQRLVISSSVCFLVLSIISFCMSNKEQCSIWTLFFISILDTICLSIKSSKFDNSSQNLLQPDAYKVSPSLWSSLRLSLFILDKNSLDSFDNLWVLFLMYDLSMITWFVSFWCDLRKFLYYD